MLNQTILTGNLGADPEVFYSSEGNPVASFNIAFRSSKKKTGWIKVVCFGRLAEVSEKYLHKGARIGLVGTLDQQKWENEEGVMRSSFQLIANSLEFIKTDGRGFDGAGVGTEVLLCLQRRYSFQGRPQVQAAKGRRCFPDRSRRRSAGRAAGVGCGDG